MNIINYVNKHICILDFARKYTNLALKTDTEYFKSNPVSYQGLCPLCAYHKVWPNIPPQKETPDFNIRTNTQIFFCLPCGFSGDLVYLASLLENLSPIKAAHKIAEMYNLNLKAIEEY